MPDLKHQARLFAILLLSIIIGRTTLTPIEPQAEVDKLALTMSVAIIDTDRRVSGRLADDRSTFVMNLYNNWIGVSA